MSANVATAPRYLRGQEQSAVDSESRWVQEALRDLLGQGAGRVSKKLSRTCSGSRPCVSWLRIRSFSKQYACSAWKDSSSAKLALWSLLRLSGTRRGSA
jgi:hypothetical protein